MPLHSFTIYSKRVPDHSKKGAMQVDWLIDPDKMILKTIYYQRILHTSFQQLQYSFAYSAPRFWNDLPLELQHSDSLARFRKGLKAHLFASAYSP